MYSQPWEKGVKIIIPIKVISNWIKETKEILEVSLDTDEITDRKVNIDNDSTVCLSCVAYSDTASREATEVREQVSWSNQNNTNFTNIITIPELTGYIKDNAWDYEKEIRLKAQFNNIHNFKRVAIRLTDEVIKEMIISAGPLFQGNLVEEIQKEIKHELKTDKSLFSGKLNITSTCEKCPYKKSDISSIN